MKFNIFEMCRFENSLNHYKFALVVYTLEGAQSQGDWGWKIFQNVQGPQTFI